MPMHGYPTPNSGGSPQPDNGAIVAAGGGKLPSGKPGGTLTISRKEAMALIAFDTEDNPTQAMNRARKETGLTHEQLARLRTRATAARSKGFELKSEKHVFKPTNYDGDEEGLLGKKELDADAKGKGKDTKTAKAKQDAKAAAPRTAQMQTRPNARETREAQARWTRLHECDGDRFCGPCRQRRAARESMMKRKRASC